MNLTTYHPPRWLRWPGASAGHAQTILPALLTPRPTVHYRRERWETPDDDFVDVDWLDATPEINPSSATSSHLNSTFNATTPAPLVVMFHGLEGSSQSHYALAFMHALAQRGWLGAIPHFRGCSGEANRTARAYHSGDAAEIAWLLQRFREQHPQRALYAVGVSLGGNALLRWLGEAGSAAQFVQAAAAVSAPLDLAAGGAALGRGLNRLYTRMFLNTLKPKTLAKIARYPHLAAAHDIHRARNLYEFDNLYTAPVHGYHNTEDYWQRASAKPVLRDIQIPTLVLNARNDPFLPAQHLPRINEVSNYVTLEQPASGGHVGFVVGNFPGRLNWLPQRLLHFFDQAAKR